MYAFKRDDSLCSTDEDRVIQLLLGAICRNAVDREEYVNCIVDSICALLYSPTVRSGEKEKHPSLFVVTMDKQTTHHFESNHRIHL